ncbi:MAG: Cof-type HAD-IIB family hydrolase [Fibrobacter sp.]|nr:Cof-type HAD-IIB family hydrolase [Fibrobacter sp.]
MKMFAFDLDGTLLNSDKIITPATQKALHEIAECGIVITLISGRLCSSMQKYVADIGINIPLVTLNGAEIFTNGKSGLSLINKITLQPEYADFLIQYAKKETFTVNYYFNGKLYTEKTAKNSKWIDLYIQQTGTEYHFLPSLSSMTGNSPSKVIFVGDPNEIDSLETEFRSKWNDSINICRTWKHYVEFLNKKADKGFGINMLASYYGISLKDVVVFGDEQNDIPMFKNAGYSIAVKNASDEIKASAKKVSAWSNDEDFLAHEWDLMKSSF